MIREASEVTVRQNLGDLLDEIWQKGDSVVIAKNGKPIAVLIDIELFGRLCSLDEEYVCLRGELAQAFSDVPPDTGMVMIDEAVHAGMQDEPKRLRQRPTAMLKDQHKSWKLLTGPTIR